MEDSIYDCSVRTIDGEETSLAIFRGKVLLVVNVASDCGFTAQYEALQAIYERYRSAGFEILGFPCNQFGAQEPGTEADIKTFCVTKYSVSFPLFAKIDVNGDRTPPLYQLLKSRSPGLMGTEAIKWNFTKFLVDREGRVVARYAPTTSPEAIAPTIEKLLRPEEGMEAR